MSRQPARYAVVIGVTFGNDDSTESVKEYSEKEYLEIKDRLLRLAKALQKTGGRWENGSVGDDPETYVNDGHLSQEDADWADNLIPTVDHGTYSVQSIEVYKYSQKQRIF